MSSGDEPAPPSTSRRTPLLPRWASGPSPAPPRRNLAVGAQGSAGRWLIVALVAGLSYFAIRTLAPLGGPLILAAWFAHLFRPSYRRVVGWTAGRDRAAAFLTVALVLALLLPLGAAAATLITGGRDLVALVMRSEGGKGALEALVSRGSSAEPTLPMLDVPSLLREYGAGAWSAVSGLANASVEMLIALFVFYAAFFGALVHGIRTHVWMLRHAPLGPRTVTRLVRAFHEAGRGLLVGTGLTAIVQGTLATIAYLALGVPRAFVLGLFTTIAALIPSVGTAIVWVPVAAGLALTGSVIKAIILAGIGIGVIGVADNVLRPVLTHSAHLELDSTLVLLAMLGGISAFGTFGLFLGPLVLRLAIEALAIAREADVFDRQR